MLMRDRAQLETNHIMRYLCNRHKYHIIFLYTSEKRSTLPLALQMLTLQLGVIHN